MNPYYLLAIPVTGFVLSIVCASVPVAQKAKNPILWKFLESLAVNLGKAKNADGPAGTAPVAIISSAIAGSIAVALGAAPSQAPQPVPVPAVTFVAIPHDPTPTVIPADVTP